MDASYLAIMSAVVILGGQSADTGRAVGEPDSVEQDSAHVADTLNRWEASYDGNDVVRLAYHRFRYDHVFRIETRDCGMMQCQRTKRVLMSCEPVEFTADAVSSRAGYSLVTGGPNFTAYCDDELLMIGEHVWSVTDPEHPRHLSVETKAPMWMVFPSTVKVLRLLAALTSGQQVSKLAITWSLTCDSDNEIRLAGTPTAGGTLAREASRIDVILDPQSYRTRAFRLTALSEDSQTTYTVDPNQDHTSTVPWPAQPE